MLTKGCTACSKIESPGKIIPADAQGYEGVARRKSRGIATKENMAHLESNIYLAPHIDRSDRVCCAMGMRSEMQGQCER